ncbi:MAG TPA: CCA tRNA nucleotidyltransferase [Planctomycetota bacterium]|nr:CCA tRNA nucleotidyltransferase [Planctomycetota bacterium]
MSRLTLFEAACRVISDLEASGYEAWIVGGAVRERLLGAPPSTIREFDVSTDAHPSAVEKIFPESFSAGRAFGVVRVRKSGHWIEVATFRTEASYSDGRRPDVIQFATASEDVLRRDFTVNGMMWNPLRDIFRDEVGGQADLRAGLIRAIGNPSERFREDGLRLLRAVRFASVRGFQLEEETEAAVRSEGKRLEAVSRERIRDELVKMVERPESELARVGELLYRTNLVQRILPPLQGIVDPGPDLDVLARIRVRSLPLFLAVLLRRALGGASLHRDWVRLCEEVAEGLRLSLKEAQLLSDLLTDRRRYRQLHRSRPYRVFLVATRPNSELHEELLLGEGDAQDVLELLAECRRSRGPVRSQPLLDGRDLLHEGFRKGRLLGFYLRIARLLQWEHPGKTREEILSMLGQRRARAEQS